MWDLTYLCNYNNYIRRQLRRHSTKQAYKNASTKYYEINDSTLFNPGDGVDTKVVANFEINIPALEVDEPDYLIVCDDNGNIKQRWFVIDCDRTRAGQYQVRLHRDVLAESWNEIKGQNAYIEKGIPLDTNTAIYNRENMTYNQILRSQVPLKDVTGCAWVVGYMTSDTIEKHTRQFIPNLTVDYNLTSLSDYKYYDYTTNGGQTLPVDIYGQKRYGLLINDIHDEPFTTNRLTYDTDPQYPYSWEELNHYYVESGLYNESQSTTVRNNFSSYLQAHSDNITKAIKAEYIKNNDFLSEENNKVIYVSSTNRYYRISVSSTVTAATTKNPEGQILNAFNDAVFEANATYKYLTDNSRGKPESYFYKISTYNKGLVLTEVSFGDTITYTLSNTRQRLIDQPYSMFCMPYGSTTITGWSGTQPADFKEISMKVAKDISAVFSGGDNPVLFDLQLLPYCPMRHMFQNNNINLSRGISGIDYQYVKQGNTNVGIIFWAKESMFSFDIPYVFDVYDKKIVNETVTLRLISPNYDGIFEFNPAKLSGDISQIDVDCSYKPYKPYIHLNPPFGNLYGLDTNDARGLICGGDFSLPQTSDAWETYERNNANYSKQFNRQIENLEINQSIERTKDWASAFVGTAEGAAQGFIMGSVVPGASAVTTPLMGAASLGAGITDIILNDKLRAETLDYTKDMYAMSMKNIQALPEALINIGAYNQNNKLFPCIETYYPEDDEYDALYNKINYNGMTVNRIGKITDYVHTWSQGNGWCYIKCSLVRPVVANSDYHYIQTVQEELNRGIFVEVS